MDMYEVYLKREDHREQWNFIAYEMFLWEEGTDVVLITDDGMIRAHSMILAASTIFRRRLNQLWRTNPPYNIRLGNVKSKHLHMVLRYLYLGEIIIKDIDVDMILGIACLLALREMWQACWRFRQQQDLNVKHYLMIRDISRGTDCLDLLNEVDKYICLKFQNINDYCFLNYQRFSYFLNAKRTHTAEAVVLVYILRWLKHQSHEQQSRYAYNLLYGVNLYGIPLDDALGILRNTLWQLNAPRCDVFITDLLNRKGLPKKERHVIVIIGINCENNLSIETYDFEERTWLLRTVDKHMQPKKLAITINGSYVYYKNQNGVLMTHDLSETQGTWLTYDARRTLMNISSAAQPESSVFVAADEAYEYRETNEAWKILDLPRLYHRGAAIAELHGKLYVVGGQTINNGHLLCAMCYDPDTRKWSNLPNMYHPRRDAGVAVSDGKLYIAGGSNKRGPLYGVEVFDPREGRWEMLPDMTMQRGGRPAVIGAGGLIIVAGGVGKRRHLNCVEVYDPQTSSWTMLPASLNQKKSFSTGIVIAKSKLKWLPE